jgi:hypothetical protein
MAVQLVRRAHDGRVSDAEPLADAAIAEAVVQLMWACIDGRTEVVFDLISRNANIDATDPCGRTPLHHAARCGQLEVVRCLVRSGANIEAESETGRTPLQWAAELGHFSTVEFLVFAGARTANCAAALLNQPTDSAPQRARKKHVSTAVIRGQQRVILQRIMLTILLCRHRVGARCSDPLLQRILLLPSQLLRKMYTLLQLSVGDATMSASARAGQRVPTDAELLSLLDLNPWSLRA